MKFNLWSEEWVRGENIDVEYKDLKYGHNSNCLKCLESICFIMLNDHIYFSLVVL